MVFLYYQVAKALIGGYAGRKRKARQPEVGPLDRSFAAAHELVQLQKRPRACQQCKKSGQKTQTGRTKESRYGCHQCHVHLHRYVSDIVFDTGRMKWVISDK